MGSSNGRVFVKLLLAFALVILLAIVIAVVGMGYLVSRGAKEQAEDANSTVDFIERANEAQRRRQAEREGEISDAQSANDLRCAETVAKLNMLANDTMARAQNTREVLHGPTETGSVEMFSDGWGRPIIASTLEGVHWEFKSRGRDPETAVDDISSSVFLSKRGLVVLEVNVESCQGF